MAFCELPHVLFSTAAEEGAVIIAVLCMEKQRHRAQTAQDHTAREWQRQERNPDQVQKPPLLSFRPHCHLSEKDDYSLTLIYLVACF